jgi:hypothetical protein
MVGSDSRLPQCWRGDALQELLYLNPHADCTPIYTIGNWKEVA